MIAENVTVASDEPAASRLTLVDRVVALVDRDPIFYSDIRRLIDLGLVERLETEGQAQFERRVLDGLIEQKVRLHEIQKFDFRPLPLDLLEEQLDVVRRTHGSSLQPKLQALGLGEEGLRRLLARQLRVLLYIEERLAPRVFVELDDIRAHYENELVPELKQRGIPIPEVAEVQEDIARLLREIRLNEEIENWTFELVARAEIDDFFDRSDLELPPIRERYGASDRNP